jgi:hypothetical protein
MKGRVKVVSQAWHTAALLDLIRQDDWQRRRTQSSGGDSSCSKAGRWSPSVGVIHSCGLAGEPSERTDLVIVLDQEV